MIRFFSKPAVGFPILLWILMAVTGCQTPEYGQFGAQPGTRSDVVLREGDTVKISFPGTPNLNTTQKIAPDGRITLPLIREITAAGKTPAALEKELLERYASQLVSKEVTVEVESTSFTIYVSGAVLHPQKVTSTRPLTALEAIMETGGFDYTRANMKKVRVIRQEGGKSQHYILNLKTALEGGENKPFYLKPADIVFVPERFSWF